MRRVGLWQITEDGPGKLKQGQIDLEKDLEEWIERDPSMLQEGLTIVGRQIVLDSGSRLDLLALDTQGRWVVIELKSGPVSRDALAQVLDYTSSIAMMPQKELYEKAEAYLAKRGDSFRDLLEQCGIQDDDQGEPREVLMYVVGTGSDSALRRMVNYLLAVRKVPISLVSYRVFELASGQRILVSELAETEGTSFALDTKSSRATVEDICVRAEQAGVGSQFRMLLEAVKRYNLYPRPYRHSIMYTPPSDGVCYSQSKLNRVPKGDYGYMWGRKHLQSFMQ